jgi:hypothetical protein
MFEANCYIRHTLGSTMTIVRILAIVHFVFGMVYAVASLTITPEQAGPLVLLVILPLSGTLTAFYIWTLNSLKFTMKDLEERKQNVKLLMYKRLWWIILGSIFTIFGFFFVSRLCKRSNTISLTLHLDQLSYICWNRRSKLCSRPLEVPLVRS